MARQQLALATPAAEWASWAAAAPSAWATPGREADRRSGRPTPERAREQGVSSENAVATERLFMMGLAVGSLDGLRPAA